MMKNPKILLLLAIFLPLSALATVRSSATLKTYFTTGSIPTQTNFGDLIESTHFGDNLAATTSLPQIATIGSSTGQTTVLGKLGIGTTTPATKLNVSGGSVLVEELTSATSTSMTVSWASSTQQLIKLGTSATTIAFSNYSAGQTLRLMVCQSINGTTTVTWPAVTWPKVNGVRTAPTLSTATNSCDLITFAASNGTSSLTVFGGYINY